MEAAKRGKEHERRLTPERKWQLMEENRKRKVALETSVRPPLPRIIVTTPQAFWLDYKTVRLGFGGAIRQE